MKKLLLLRHAKSSHANPLFPDKERILNDRGRNIAPRIGKELILRNLIPELILCSTAMRARETADLLIKGLGHSVPVHYEEELYLADPATILAHAQGAPEDIAVLMIVGHNPGFGSLAFALSGQSKTSHEFTKFPTAALATFQFQTRYWVNIDPTYAKLIDFFTPKQLKEEAE